ncbi:conserved hypothetical protein [Pyrobaculum islandicum DSM 4184]|uniref:Uncharacterized protein n=1 Tax=Pyrobaculum islandicum (strain DSM 4184 / JCM 9189 / GEO3) TaxID=384616 RepID=A1RU16_PYRIL|nr:hypothetical protein [Pyrobaculum islandicum]ABL88448.1 conserved hypothetical protein [Pyrobaculum islandicum DSM 4184]
MGEEITPVYAQGFYVVNPGIVNMIIIFDYLDKGQYYYRLLKRGGEELSKEISTVWENMQRFMDEEVVRINGERVRPMINDVYIGLRGSPNRPYITFIGFFPAPLKSGENIYENYYEEEVAEYDYEAIWIFPQNVEIFEWHFGGNVETPEPYILRVYVEKGTNVGGREYIKFRLQ